MNPTVKWQISSIPPPNEHPGILVFKELKGIITDESDISEALITKSIGSGKTKVLDHKQIKVLDYMNRNLQTVGVETSIKDATLLIYKNKIGSIHVIDNKKIGRHHLNSRYAGVVHRSDGHLLH